MPGSGPAAARLAPGQVAATASLPATPGAQWPVQDWWRRYGDGQLDTLMREGLASSPDIATAQARFARAAAMAQQARGATLPRLDAQGQGGGQRNSTRLGFPDEIASRLPQSWVDFGQISANLGFDLDLWGKNRAALAAATSERRAAALDIEQARLMLSVAIASAYVDLARLHAERDLRASEVETSAASTRLMEQRRASGLETRGSTASAAVELAGARIALSAADEALDLRRHQLAALVGAGPDRGLAITRPRLADLPGPDLAGPDLAGPDLPGQGVPPDVTTNLIGRRPDIVAARERVEAAASRIKVARADFFPSIKLSAMLGFQSVGLGQLFDQGARTGFVGPAFSLPIFHGGELAGRYRGARADYDVAVAAYNGAVLAGYQQAADAVTIASMVGQRLVEARGAGSEAEAAFREITRRYGAGLVNYLQVLQVKDRLLRAQLQVVQLEQAVRNADVGLVRALGGGYGPAATAGATTANTKDSANG